LQGDSFTPYTCRMRRLVTIALILFLVIGVPLAVYFWARNTGKPVAIPFLDRALPKNFGLQTKAGVNLSDFQNAPTPLADPITGETCFLENNYTCLYNNTSTQSGILTVELNNTARPDHRLSLGIFFGNVGALEQHYQFGLANGGQDALPIYSSIRTVLDQGNRNNISPMFLLAYYDFMLAQAKLQNVPPQEWGLPLSDAFPLSPSPADVAATFRVARQLFPEEGSAFENAEIAVQDDVLSSMLKNTQLSQAGRAMIYSTTQLFGSQVASQIFTQPDMFSVHYNALFRDPRFSGTFAIQSTQTEVNPFEYYSRDPRQRELVICDDQVALSCPYIFDDTTLGGEGQLAVCDSVPFLDSFCADGTLETVTIL